MQQNTADHKDASNIYGTILYNWAGIHRQLYFYQICQT